MLDHIIQKWAGHRFYANLPEAQFYSFRETGYAGNLLKALDSAYPEIYQKYDVLLYFQLVHNPPIWKVHDFKRPLILFVAGHEAPDLPEEVIKSASIVFKQYLDPKFGQKYKHLFRIPVGPSSVFPDTPLVDFEKRDCNVFFAGNLHKGRQRLYQQLSGLTLLPFPVLYRLREYLKKDFSALIPTSTITFSSQFHSGFSAADYAARLASAKIVLCPYGVDQTETMRHFEAGKQGCVIVSDVMPDTFYFRKAPFIIIRNWKNVKKEILELIAEEKLLQQKHEAILAWWKQCCSIEALTNFVIETVKQSELTFAIKK
jgi:hypothetical protein